MRAFGSPPARRPFLLNDQIVLAHHEKVVLRSRSSCCVAQRWQAPDQHPSGLATISSSRRRKYSFLGSFSQRYFRSFRAKAPSHDYWITSLFVTRQALHLIPNRLGYQLFSLTSIDFDSVCLQTLLSKKLIEWGDILRLRSSCFGKPLDLPAWRPFLPLDGEGAPCHSSPFHSVALAYAMAPSYS